MLRKYTNIRPPKVILAACLAALFCSERVEAAAQADASGAPAAPLAKNGRDGKSFLDGLLKTFNDVSDYEFTSVLTMPAKGNDPEAKGLFYFKQSNLIRAEDQ